MNRFPATQLFLAFTLLLGGACGSGSGVDGSGGKGGMTGGGTGGAGTGGSGSGGSTPGSGGVSPGTGGSVATDTATDVSVDLPADTGPSGSGGSSLPDPGPEGDGDRTIAPPYNADPLVGTPAAGVPRGRFANFTVSGTDSQIYKGVTGNYMRSVRVYVPMQYVAGTAAPFIVTQDAMGQGELPNALDNLISMKKLPKLVVLFVNSGGGDSLGSERGLEYDTVSGLFAEYIDKEILPRAIAAVKTQLMIDLKFTTDPEGRGTYGGSSGGAASFSMAWWHPDLFRRVIAYSGTFVSQVPEGSPFPHGCWVYHDVDPRFVDGVTEAPKGLIVQHCEPKGGFVSSGNPGTCDTPLTQAACETAGCTWNTKVNRPVRVWIESGENDLTIAGRHGPAEYRDFNLANHRMAMALKARGYHYHYDYARGAGHVDGGVVRQTVVEALLYVWRGYPIN
jgi:enterochelin esterase family protein